ncbi:MAG: hypothetical protein ACXVXN_00640 [Mycobacteriaceae bacterium]
MAASEAAVTAAQAKAGCWFEETAAGLFCNAHHCYADQRHETRDECDVIAAIADAAVDADRASIQAEARLETFAEASRAMNRVADIWESDGSDRCRVRVNRENANAYRLYAEGLGQPTGSKKETKP